MGRSCSRGFCFLDEHNVYFVRRHVRTDVCRSCGEFTANVVCGKCECWSEDSIGGGFGVLDRCRGCWVGFLEEFVCAVEPFVGLGRNEVRVLGSEFIKNFPEGVFYVGWRYASGWVGCVRLGGNFRIVFVCGCFSRGVGQLCLRGLRSLLCFYYYCGRVWVRLCIHWLGFVCFKEFGNQVLVTCFSGGVPTLFICVDFLVGLHFAVTHFFNKDWVTWRFSHVIINFNHQRIGHHILVLLGCPFW